MTNKHNFSKTFTLEHKLRSQGETNPTQYFITAINTSRLRDKAILHQAAQAKHQMPAVTGGNLEKPATETSC